MGRKRRPPRFIDGELNPDYTAHLARRLEKRHEREATRAIPNIRLSAEDFRQRVSASSLSKELGLPVAVVKQLLPRRTASHRKDGKFYQVKSSVTTLGRAVRILNESQDDSPLLSLLKK